MAPKRKSTSGQAGPPPKKQAKAAPAWDWTTANPTWTTSKPTGEHGTACVEKYCLLAPYDSAITEDQWKAYSTERAGLDTLNTPNSKLSYNTVECRDLNDSWPGFTLTVLSSASSSLAREIMGTTIGEGEKLALSRTLRGSLYLLSVQGQDDGDGSPRNVEAKLRLYGPQGLGSSVDFTYYYNHRSGHGDHNISLLAFARSIKQCGLGGVVECWTHETNPKTSREKGRPGVIPVFQCYTTGSNDDHKNSGTILSKLQILEQAIVGRSGLMSMKKLYAVAIAASTAGLWREEELSDDLSSILSKVKNHPGETDGSAEAEDEEENVNDGIVSYDYNDFLHLTGGECVPHKLLGLAKKGQK